MKDRTEPLDPAAAREAAERAIKGAAIKGAAIKSGAATARAVKSRTHRRKRIAQPPSNAVVTRSSAYIEPQVREAMIADSAYFRSAHRGFEPGHEVEDWLAAESEIDAALARGDMSPLCG